MEKDSIYKALLGTISGDEKVKFFSWLEENDANTKFYYEMKNLWVEATIGKKYNEVNELNEFDKFWAVVNQKERKRSLFSIAGFLRYAAVILIAFLTGWSINRTNPVIDSLFKKEYRVNTLTSKKGSIATFQLTDSTKIWLNSNSELQIPHDFSSRRRNVKLEGEAYFEVFHDPKRPFLVDMEFINVEVVGTSFNLSSYPELQSIEASLEMGIINIIRKDNGHRIRLYPGQKASYEKSSGRITIEEVDPVLISEWKDFRFIFRDKSLGEICLELETWYGVKFRFEDETLKYLRYTGNIERSSSVNPVLQMLKITADIDYSINENSD